ncbi:MAG: hypothetical protein HN855_15850 [Anaerolineae bacterium]|jgi:hypothetical protein|nr:hypothetical protein [Anaerolineae bacterium]MBT7073150.1 hypothetical protein [Anaerolineae bacterium]MBT7326624.1 hypothetical protein [Anaerolineae bacterium]
MSNFLVGIRVLNEILTAGVAITAFSLFLYALTFNLRNRVARSFAVIMLCVVVVFTAESMQNNTVPNWGLELLLQIQWFGIVFLPAAYLHLSDSLLITAGMPSRGRRRLAVRLVYVLSAIFLLLLGFGLLFGDFVANGQPAPHLRRTFWTEVFTGYYVLAMVWAWINFARAFNQMLTRSGRRRMLYLMAGATAPALGSYPYLMYGSSIAEKHLFLFWTSALTINIFVGGLIVVMAYAVAFFGVSWPDRLVKSRLFKWILRGPVTASITLGVMTVVRRGGEIYDGNPYSALVPFTMIVSVLLIEHTITVLAPLWERALFFGGDREELMLLQNIEERLLTRSDLRQFLDAVLAAVRDLLQSPLAFIAALDEGDLATITMAGNKALLDQDHIPDLLRVSEIESGQERQEFAWGDFLILPLRKRKREMDRDETPPLLGILGVMQNEQGDIEHDQRDSLWLLAERAALALEDRQLQQSVFQSLQDLQPQAEVLQRWRASGRYDSKVSMLSESLPPEADLANWVKDALSHYWGGPKLSDSPLMELEVVQKTAAEHDGNTVNALRSILRKGVDNIRPEGERRFTGEWILYNILEMKFIEGRKVRDVATRLAMSEADLYRKQRVAVEAVAKLVLEMETEIKLPD